MHGPQDGHRDRGVVRHHKTSGERVFVHLTAHAVEFLQRKAEMVMVFVTLSPCRLLPPHPVLKMPKACKLSDARPARVQSVQS